MLQLLPVMAAALRAIAQLGTAIGVQNLCALPALPVLMSSFGHQHPMVTALFGTGPHLRATLALHRQLTLAASPHTHRCRIRGTDECEKRYRTSYFNA